MESHEQIDDGHVALRGLFSCLHLDQIGWEKRRREKEREGANRRREKRGGVLEREALPSL